MAYDYGSYGSYSQDPTFKRLQTEFAAAFGPSFPTFSWEAYTSDADYARRINEQIGQDSGRAPGRQAALDAIRDYFAQNTGGLPSQREGFGIDVESLYGPLRDEVKRLGSEELSSGTATIGRETQRAREATEESIAGTGLGRSGVSAAALAGVENDRAARVESLSADIAKRSSEAQYAISQRIADLKLSEELRARGADEDFIRSTLDARRAMDMAQYQTMLDIARDDAASSWWDQYVLPVLSVAGQAYGAKG